MPAPVFIGDEVTAAGYRLAGAVAYSPGDDDLADVFRRALQEADLILLEVDYARRLPAAEINAAQRALRPRLFVVPDIRGRERMRDLFHRLHAQLGVNV